jgi:hypothetical protein
MTQRHLWRNPYLTLADLRQEIEKLVLRLEGERETILKHGFLPPPYDWMFLVNHLGATCPVRSRIILESGQEASDAILLYQDPQPPAELGIGISKSTAEEIFRLRPKYLELKIKILKELIHHLKLSGDLSPGEAAQQGRMVTRRCFEILMDTETGLAQSEVDLLIDLHGKPTPRLFEVRRTENDPVFLRWGDGPWRIHSGGILSLFYVIGHCREEIEVGYYRGFLSLPRNSILSASGGMDWDALQPGNPYCDHLEITGHEVTRFWGGYCREIEEQLQEFPQLVKVSRERLAMLRRLEREGRPDLPIAMEAPAEETGLETQQETFPEIPGLKWEEVDILIDGDFMTVEARDTTKTFHFSKIGFGDGRKDNLEPKELWRHLYTIAEQRGEMRFPKLGHVPAMPQGRMVFSSLRKHLKAIIPINDDPFEDYKTEKGYKTRFRLSAGSP